MKLLTQLIGACAVCVAASGAHAAYIESGDASNYLASAQVATDSIIQGTIGEGDHGDVFKLVFGSAGTLTVLATSLGVDTQIGLFDAGFNALVGDDDSAGNLDSVFSYAIGAGTYYLGIGDFATYAINGSSQAWELDGLAPVGFGAISYIQNQSSISSGDYNLSLSMTPLSQNTVPEPGTTALLGLGLIGLAALRRKG